METFNIPLDMKAMVAVFETHGFYNVSKEEIETVIRACLTQYLRDGWCPEVLCSELLQLRTDPEVYKKDAGIE